MKLTPNFMLDEFKVSGSRPDLAAKITFNELEIYKLRLISRMHLEPMRSHIGGPVRILSGKRTRELNSAVGGSPTSRHLVSEAVDFTCNDLKRAFEFIRKSPNSFGQMIFYLTKARAPRFIHISLPTGKRQGKALFNIAGKFSSAMP